jgi:ankyrin repeat protein
MMNDVVSTGPGVTRRVTRSQTREGRSAAVRVTSVGEDVIFCKLIRDGALRHLNPWKLSDLQSVLEMRCFEGLLSDEDLKEVYFQRMWGFKGKWEFVLAGWREMSVEDMKERIRWALRDRMGNLPGMKEHLMTLYTKEQIMREYGMLAYVPGEIAKNAMCGVWTLRQIREVGVENLDDYLWHRCYNYLCRAGADFSIIRSLYEVRPPTAFVDAGRPEWVCDDGVVAAARRGHLDIVEGLIGTLGHDVDAIDLGGMTALMAAAHEGHTDIVHALAVKYNANVDDGDTTALMYAAERGQTDTVHALAGTYNVNVDAEDREGYTALMRAAKCGHADVVHALAGTYNADVEIGSDFTALSYAAQNGHTDIVNILAGTYNANVDAVDEIGLTALMCAAMNGHTETVHALAGTYNANVEAVDNDGWTALMHAAENGHTATVNALAGTHNANVEAVGEYGKTALMIAAMYGHTDTAEALRALGASR